MTRIGMFGLLLILLGAAAVSYVGEAWSASNVPWNQNSPSGINAGKSYNYAPLSDSRYWKSKRLTPGEAQGLNPQPLPPKMGNISR